MNNVPGPTGLALSAVEEHCRFLSVEHNGVPSYVSRMKQIYCSLKKNGVDYIVENSTVDDGKTWINYGTLAGNMPGVGGRLVFVANPKQALELLNGTTHATIELFEKRALKHLEG